MNILIKNVELVPMDGKDEYLSNMNIYIKDGKIEEIYSGEKLIKVDKVIDGKNKLAMPGLINTHTHLGMSLFRNYADDLPLHDWLNDKIWPIEAKLTPEDIYWGSLLSMVEMIETGTTTFLDMYFFMDEVGNALKESGMRGVLSRGMSDDNDEKLNQEKFDDLVQLHKNWHNKLGGKSRVAVGTHSIYICGTKFLKTATEYAEKLDIPIHIHLSETKKEVEDSYLIHGKSPIEYSRDIGLFKVPTAAAHCVVVDDNDLRILKEENVFPINNPASNMKLASGFAPVNKMIQMGIPVALGTDGSSSNNNLNMFEEISLAAIINKGLTEDATAVTAYEAIEMATVNGAKALQWFDQIGSLEQGKNADIILIDLDKSHLYPRNNPVSSLAYSVQGSDVDTVMVDGDIIMENREIKTLDVERIKFEVERIKEELEMR